jgi:hypothetical protein
MAAYEVLLLNTAVPQIQAAQSGDTYVVPRDIAFSAALTLSAGTANGVPYLNASKVLTTGSALTFDGTKLGIGTSTPPYMLSVSDGGATGFEVGPGATYVAGRVLLQSYNRSGSAYTGFDYSASEHKFLLSGSDAMVLNSTGLGIGTSSPGTKLEVAGSAPAIKITADNATQASLQLTQTGVGNWLKYFRVSDSAFVEQFGGNDLLFLSTVGNLGLGVTPSAWSGYRAIQMGAYANFYNTNAGQTGLATSTYNNGTNWIYNSNNPAFRYEQDLASQSHRWFIAPTGTAGNAISFTQAMTLDASGNLLVGYTTTQSFNAALQIKRADATAGATTYTLAWFANATGYENGLAVKATDNAVTLAADFNGAAGGAAALVFATNSTGTANNATERARITSGGNFQTSSGNSVQVGGTAARATTAGTNRVDIFDGTAPVGTLANGVSFYSAAGEANVMDAAGNATLLSPHDSETNEWIFRSKHTPTGKVLRIDVERLLRFVNAHFGLDAVKEFVEE